MEFMNDNAHKLLTLGRFALGYICENPQVLFKPQIYDVDWEESAKVIISTFYSRAGLPRPAWLDEPLKDNESEDEGNEIEEFDRARAQLRMVLLNHFNEKYNRYVRTLTQPIRSNEYNKVIDYPDTDVPLHERVRFCIVKNLTAHFTINSQDRVVIHRSILDEIERGGVDPDIVGSLKQIAEILEMNYNTLRVGGRDGKTNKVIYGDFQSLQNFLQGDDYS
jgi:hypothetical protein